MDGTFLLGVSMGLTLTSGLVLEARRVRRDGVREQSAWGEYAARHGFQYSNGVTAISHRVQHSVVGCVEGIPLSCSTGIGILQMPTTTITAPALAPIDGRIYVACSDLFAQGGDDVLARRVAVGDPEFNGAPFVIHATTADLAGRVLVGPVRALLREMNLAGRQSLNFRCDRDRVSVSWLGVDPVPELLDLGCNLVLAACGSRQQLGAYRSGPPAFAR